MFIARQTSQCLVFVQHAKEYTAISRHYFADEDRNMLSGSHYQAQHCFDMKLALRYLQSSVRTSAVSVLLSSSEHFCVTTLVVKRRPHSGVELEFLRMYM
jgi:hypothetical protein